MSKAISDLSMGEVVGAIETFEDGDRAVPVSEAPAAAEREARRGRIDRVVELARELAETDPVIVEWLADRLQDRVEKRRAAASAVQL